MQRVVAVSYRRFGLFFRVITQLVMVILPTFRDKLSVQFSGFKYLNAEDGTDKLSRNVGKKLPLLAA